MTEIRMTIPECPACFRPHSDSIHASPMPPKGTPLEIARRTVREIGRRRALNLPAPPPAPECGGKLWLDLMTGRVRCEGCEQSWDFAGTTHNCSDCGCKYEGGHTWAAGAAVTGATAEWIAAAGITDKTTITGWDEEMRRAWQARQPGALQLSKSPALDPPLTSAQLRGKADTDWLLRNVERAKLPSATIARQRKDQGERAAKKAKQPPRPPRGW